eukprot:UN03029
MAGGPSTPAMAAATIRAGAMGSLGFAYSGAEKIAAELSATHSLIGADHRGGTECQFFRFSTGGDARSAACGMKPSKILFAQTPVYPLSLSTQKPPTFPHSKSSSSRSGRQNPSCLTFHFGIPGAGIIDQGS